MTRLLLSCCLLLALAVHAPSQANEPNEPDAAAQNNEPQAASNEPTAESPRPRDNAPFEVFVPSEQISEDIPVPFPVDI